MTGVFDAAQSATTAATSSVERAKTTASGAKGWWYDSSLPCWSRTAWAVDRRSPKRCRRAAMRPSFGGSRARTGAVIIGRELSETGAPPRLSLRAAALQSRVPPGALCLTRARFPCEPPGMPAVLFHSSSDSAARWRAALAAVMPELEFRPSTDPGDTGEIEYALVWKPPAGLLATLPRLKVIASLGAGIDHIL